MDRTDYFDNLREEQFACWLAGFFDGEGCVYIPKAPGIEVSVSSTEEAVIRRIHSRIGLGAVHVVVFDQPGWKTKYSLRIRTYEECKRFLEIVRPFLTIKAAKADLAMERIVQRLARMDRVLERHAEIQKLRDAGRTQQEIADTLGVARTTVCTALAWMQVNGNTHKGRRVAMSSLSRQRHIKNKSLVRTESRKSADSRSRVHSGKRLSSEQRST